MPRPMAANFRVPVGDGSSTASPERGMVGVVMVETVAGGPPGEPLAGEGVPGVDADGPPGERAGNAAVRLVRRAKLTTD